MVDVSLPSDLEAVLKQGSHWEQQYAVLCAGKRNICLVSAWPESNCVPVLFCFFVYLNGKAGEGSAEVMEALNQAAACYATAIKLNGRDPRGHLGLALVLEEKFYAKDMFGHKEVEVSKFR